MNDFSRLFREVEKLQLSPYVVFDRQGCPVSMKNEDMHTECARELYPYGFYPVEASELG